MLGYTNHSNSPLSAVHYRDMNLPLVGVACIYAALEPFWRLASTLDPADLKEYSFFNYSVKLASSVSNPQPLAWERRVLGFNLELLGFIWLEP